MRGNRSNHAAYRLIAGLAAMALIFAAPTAAIAQQLSPTDEEYELGIVGEAETGGPSDDGAEPVSSTSEPVTAPASSSSELPFTGLNVAAIAAIGIGLVGAGFVIRQVARADSTRT